MYRNIYTHIIDSLDDRSSEIIDHIASHNNNYAALTNRILELQNNILKYLPEDSHSLLLDSQLLLKDRDSLKNLILYKQGVIDGIQIEELIRGNFDKRFLII